MIDQRMVRYVVQALKSRRIINPIFFTELPDKLIDTIVDEVNERMNK